MNLLARSLSILLVLLPAAALADPAAADPGAALLLARARQSHYSGDFTASVVCVRESFLEGTDTLRGILVVRAAAGERRLALRGPRDSFEWWSRLHGREQWRRDGPQGRPRRIPPYSLKKPAFAPEVSFEDLARLPFGHLEGFRAAHRGEGDTAIRATPAADLASLYASLEIAFGRDPFVLRRIVFAGSGTRPSKRMEIPRYTAEPGGFFPAEIVFLGGEGLSSVRLLLTLLREDPARDKVVVPDEPAPRFAEPQWLPRDDSVSTR